MDDSKPQQKLAIFVIINNAVDNKRLGIARVLRAEGHHIRVCNKSTYEEIRFEFIEFNKKHKVDFIVTFSWSFIHCGGRPFEIAAFKSFWQNITTNVVVLWDDSPLRWKKIVVASNRIIPNIKHFVIDSIVVEQLKRDGVDAAYFPIYYVDSQYMTSEKVDIAPNSDVILCGNVADVEQFFQLLPGPSDVRYLIARKFLDQKTAEGDAYIDELQFVADQSLDLNALEQPHFLAILTGIQRTVDRTRILQRIPSGIRVGLVGHNLSSKEIPAGVTRYPGVSHAAIGHIYALPILQFGTSGWPAACNLRLFQAAAMGGIMLHEDRPDARRHFSPEADGFFYTDTDHLIALMEGALVHRERYEAAAVETKRRFDKEHTVMHRARQLVEMMCEP